MTRLLVLLAIPLSVFAQTDLTGLKFCIDPGHGGNNPVNDRHIIPDPGINFWESESNFQKALLLKALLEARGADTVILTRYTNYYPNDDEPSLSARVATSNANNVNWFHSIHSNATGLPLGQNNSINSTLMLVREQLVTSDSVYGPGNGQPLWPEAWNMSGYMGQNIRASLRTTGWSRWTDYSFYRTYTLGVLRGLFMPGELSEGSFHDYYPETRRLMNNDYRKMEAYALLKSFLQYYNVPPDTLCIIAGIQTDGVTGKPKNIGQTRLLPLNRIYAGDSFNNGFYLFDSLSPGQYSVVFETPDYERDTVDITVSAGSILFVDRTLAYAYPTVAATPASNDTLVDVGSDIVLSFTNMMDTASVRQAFSISPTVDGTIQWSADLKIMTFTPSAVFPYFTTTTVTVDSTANCWSGLVFHPKGIGYGYATLFEAGIEAQREASEASTKLVMNWAD